MITSTKNNSLKSLCVSLLFLLSALQNSSAQISFNQSNLNFNGIGNVNIGVTGMSFGPDDRLYVVEYTGAVKIFSITRNGPTDYEVTAVEELNGILTIQDHNDDGAEAEPTLFGIPGVRETIDIAVGGTASIPVFYVSSSDIRIGAGTNGGNGDVGLDTNSGIITRFSWNGTSWDVVDLVRGLPRSEENHATNGLELATINGTNYLIVAQGGHTNGGAPSTNFVYTCEYALSAAVLSINLDMLNAMPILNDNGRSYIYDLPTLDDPTRPNVNGITDPDVPGYDGIDIGDPFGGNDGLNMAIVVPNGPVQILSPGYRNAFDLVVTESGALYVTDNGANSGWGGLPENQGTANVTNNYNTLEPGSVASNPSPSGEYVNNNDHLQLVTTNLNSYTFNSLYGGHPNPVRANPQGAGLYTDNTSALGITGNPIWRTKIYHPNAIALGENFTNNPNEGLPANWPPVPSANPVEGDWRGPGIPNPDGPADNPVVIWGTNTNSIDEYTASNFEGVLKGNLLAGHSGGNIRRVILSPNGASGTLEPNFFSGIGGNVLGLTCNGDNDIFPGTVWAGTLNGKIVVMEPQDAVICLEPGDSEYNASEDYDNDGYTNQDEVDNGTDPCNGGSQPSDFDKVLGPPYISDLNDTDDDGDGIPDSLDPFQLGNPLATGSQAFTIPIANDLFNDQQGLGGIFGLGMTGLMNNGAPNPNWLNWIDRRDDPNDPNPNDVLGGAPGIMTSHMTSGTALGTANNQEKGYQYGVQVTSDTAPFSVIGGMNGFSGGFRLYDNMAAVGGELGFFIGDGTQSNYIKFVVTVDGFTVLQEIEDVPQTPVNVSIPVDNRPTGGIRFYFVINPSTGSVSCDYQIDANSRINITTLTAQGSILEALQQTNQDLAVGFIGTSGVSGVELEGSWDFLNVLGSQPTIVLELPDLNRLVGSAPESINLNSYFTDDGGSEALTYTVETNTDPSIGATITNTNLDLFFPVTPALSTITIRATDAENNFIEQSFTVNVTEEPFVLYRVNAGGPEITAIDDAINWVADTAGASSEFLSVPGSNSTFTPTITSTTSSVNTDEVPLSIFQSERYDSSPGQPNLTYSFPVAENGNYEVRLYMGNGFDGTSQPGQRIFNATIEDNFYPELLNIDLSERYGHQVGAVISQIVPVNDGFIDITLLHNVENPLINGIEILKASSIDTPIYANAIADQLSFPGEALDGSLGVVATGGDGNLQFTTIGLPPGIDIDPTNGQIGGTIDINAADNSPYNVTITIDDSDSLSTDAVTLEFTWVVEALSFTIEPIDDITSYISDVVNFNVVTTGGNPTEQITFTIENQPDGVTIDASTGIISGTIAPGAELGGPTSDGVYLVTITAIGTVSGAINVDISWTVTEKPTIAFRLNAGGAAIPSTDGELDWVANATTGALNGTGYSVNTGNIAGSGLTYANRHASIPSYIDQATYSAIFAQERWDPASEPEMQFNIPLPNGDYIVNLFLGNNYELTSQEGTRIFDILLEGNLVKDNLDLIAEFGHEKGGMLSLPITLTDGEVNLLFEHVTQNPLINAIEILNGSLLDVPISANAIDTQFSLPGEVLDGSLGVSAFGGQGNLQYNALGLPPGVTIDPINGQIAGTIGINATDNSPYTVTITVDDSDEISTDALTLQFTWVITNNLWFDKNENETYTARHECSFVQAGDKFYLFGGRENAQTIDIYHYTTNTWETLVNSAPLEFNHFQALEYQGLIWVIGAFKTNSYPSETPADYIWAFNPATQEWIQGPEIPINRRRGSAGLVIHNNKFYVLAGNTIGHNGGYVNWFDEYDPATGIWTVLADAPRARDHFHSAVINGKLYAASGRLSGGTGGVFAPLISEVDVYDFDTASWSTLSPSQNIPTPRAGAIVANFENKLIVSGGESPATTDALNTTEIFDPVSQSWSIGAPLIHQRHGTQGIVSGDGIFIAGGSPVRGGGNQKNMEFYGQDNPVGLPSVASVLSAESNLDFETGETKILSITNSGGNVGAIIKTMTLSGTDAVEFSIEAGDVPFKLIQANTSHTITISHTGNDYTEKNATLTITYNNSDTLIINLSVIGYGLVYNGTEWIPSAPNQTTSTENALILNGSYAVNSDIEINNLSVRDGASLIVEYGKSIIAHGDLKIDGTLELQSTSISYSSLIADGTVEGNVVYKRHVHRTAAAGASDANDLIAAPLSGQAFNEFRLNNSNIVSNSTNTLFLFGPFNKTTGAYTIYSNTETSPLEAGIGYRAASTDLGTFTFTGNLNTSSIAVPISNSGPAYQVWNLIGNPYPSYLNAAAFLSANNAEFSENSAGIYGYDGNASDGWIIWNQAYADSNPNSLISPGQGFFVASKPSGGTVNFTPSMRVKGNSDDFIAGRNSSTLPSYLKLNISQNDKTYHTDFYFNPNATRGLDKGYDAQVWGGNAPSLSIFSYLVEGNTGLPMAIQSLDETDYSNLLVPLGIKGNLGDQLTVSITENTLPSTVEVYLEDYLLQTSTLLNNSDYSLTPVNSLNTFGRFYLSFTDSALSTKVSNLNTLNVFNNAQNQSLVITGIITEPTVAKLYDIQGRLVISESLSLNTSQQHIDAQHLDKGVYVISISHNFEKMTKKIIIR